MNYNYIQQISKYESKLFIRDTSFRIIFLIGFCLIFFLHLNTHSKLNHPEWVAISLPSSIPYANAWLTNYLQFFIILLYMSRFCKAMNRRDTQEAISIRPFSNSDYLFGKLSGCFKVVMTCNLIWIGIALLVHLFISDSPFAFFPYLFYFLTLTLPAFFFLTGLTVSLQALTKFIGLSLLLVIGLLYVSIRYTTDLFSGLASPLAESLPNTFSEISGFYGLNTYLLHRFSYFCWGIGLLLIGIFSVRRLPNASRHRMPVMLAAGVLLFCGVLSASMYLHHFSSAQQLRQQYRETFMKYEQAPKAEITRHQIYFRQVNDTYKASSTLQLSNPTGQTIPEIILYLNPGLQVNSVMRDNHSIPFKRDHQIIILQDSLSRDNSCEINIQYEGGLCAEICYPEFTNLKEEQKKRNYSFLNPGHAHFYLQPDYTLLTPECLWYPTAYPPVIVNAPYTTFQAYTNFELTVCGETNREVISQGFPQHHENSIRFTSSYKQPGLSLCMGPYICKSIVQDSILYELWLLKGHEYLIESFKNPKEIIESWQMYASDYPFNKLALIETPIHFCAYSRFWKNQSEYIQPELIFRPEWDAWSRISPILKEPGPQKAGIYVMPPEASYITAQIMGNSSFSRTLYSDNLFLKKLWKRNTSVTTQNEYNFENLKEKYQFFIYSTEFNGIDRIIKSMQNFWENVHKEMAGKYTFIEGTEYMQKHSLQESFRNRSDNNLEYRILQKKSNYFLRNILCYVPFQTLYHFNQTFIQEHAFENVDYKKYCEEFQKATGTDLYDITYHLFTSKRLPSFIVQDAEIYPVSSDNEGIRYIQSVKVWNKGPEEGVITLSGYHQQENSHYFIPAGSAREICTVFTTSPDESISLEVNTNLSENIPATFLFENLQPKNQLTSKEPGIYNLDTSYFLPDKNEYIVDDGDAGFRIISPKSYLKKRIRQETSLDIQGYSTPKHWTRYYATEAYGQPIRSYYSRMAGEENTKIIWETTLREAGEYEVFIYNDDFAIKYGTNYRSWRGEKDLDAADPIQTYNFSHAEGEETIQLETKEAGSGWVSLGRYYFKSGPVSISLTDRGADSHQVILADAVKWVKRK